jgi:GNAT superfamily N-acetyltransferase
MSHRFEYTDGTNPNLISLCQELDQSLDEFVAGKFDRAKYSPYNQLEDIDTAILAYKENTPLACVCLKKYNTECAEVKRLFVRKAYRKNGIAKELMRRLETLAKEKGYQYLILESGEPLKAAMKLYHNLGFQIIPNYEPYQNMSESICMKKKL